MDTKELITVEELAKKLRVPKSWVYGKTREHGPGAIPRIRTGKYLRFEYDAVMDWLKNSTASELE